MYTITGKLTVTATSKVHNTTIVWDKLIGDADADPDALDRAKASFSVDMLSYDAGDWMKNRRLRSDYDLERHHTATFSLDRVSNIVREGARFEATATGTLRWRGIEIPLEVIGKGTLDAHRLAATATFSLDVTRFGIQPPKLFMFKVDNVATMEVAIVGVAT